MRVTKTISLTSLPPLIEFRRDSKQMVLFFNSRAVPVQLGYQTPRNSTLANPNSCSINYQMLHLKYRPTQAINIFIVLVWRAWPTQILNSNTIVYRTCFIPFFNLFSTGAPSFDTWLLFRLVGSSTMKMKWLEFNFDLTNKVVHFMGSANFKAEICK